MKKVLFTLAAVLALTVASRYMVVQADETVGETEETAMTNEMGNEMANEIGNEINEVVTEGGEAVGGTMTQ